MSRISSERRERIYEEARNRCGYCQTPQEIVPMPFEIDHIIPQAAGGSDEDENLWLACRNCNGFKHSRSEGVDPETNQTVSLFNPRTQDWNEHFEFSQDRAVIIGKTACGRATVVTLRLNFDQAVKVRKRWVEIGWYPPKDQGE